MNRLAPSRNAYRTSTGVAVCPDCSFACVHGGANRCPSSQFGRTGPVARFCSSARARPGGRSRQPSRHSVERRRRRGPVIDPRRRPRRTRPGYGAARAGAVDQPCAHRAANSTGRPACHRALAGRNECPRRGDSQATSRLHASKLCFRCRVESIPGGSLAHCGARRRLHSLPARDSAFHRGAIPAGD